MIENSAQFETNTFRRELEYFESERLVLSDPTLLPRPKDIAEGMIAYNPSRPIEYTDEKGRNYNIMYARHEPEINHLGNSYIKPYLYNIDDINQPLEQFDGGIEVRGEDPAVTRIQHRLASGAFTNLWILSCVHINTNPKQPDKVDSIHTEFYAGEYLSKMDKIAEGPKNMKDIRLVQRCDSTEIDVYGRPQTQAYSGNVTHTAIPRIENLRPEIIAAAPYIDDNLYKIGSGEWGGINDGISLGDGRVLLLAHRAMCVGGENCLDRRYIGELLIHDVNKKVIKKIGDLALADDFKRDRFIKENAGGGLRDVVFPGGFRVSNGQLTQMSCGVSDGSIGIYNIKLVRREQTS